MLIKCQEVSPLMVGRCNVVNNAIPPVNECLRGTIEGLQPLDQLPDHGREVGRDGAHAVLEVLVELHAVLAEGDDRVDPIVDIARASLDGQVMLSRRLADAAMYPAIDLEGSVSRVADQIVSTDWLKRANRFRRLWTLYQQNKDLIQIGAYEQGSNPEIDEAIQKRAVLEAFMMQDSTERFNVQQTEQLLSGIV